MKSQEMNLKFKNKIYQLAGLNMGWTSHEETSYHRHIDVVKLPAKQRRVKC
jgi:hypothetical protein